jgi:ABC-type transport system involved in multi-copper enzyme maturation permease subunit
MIFTQGFTFGNFLIDVFSVFMFILWFWLFITITSDLFRRHDISGFMKVLWVIFLILLPYIGIFAYVLTQGRSMAMRNQERAQQARDELRHIVGYSVADEIEKLDRLKASGSLTEDEYKRLRAKLID